MAGDSDNIVVGANGSIFSAPASDSLVLPEDVTTAIPVAFTDSGFASEDGVSLTVGGDITDIGVWQSAYPARQIRTSQTATIAFVLREYSAENVTLAYGGGTIDDAAGVAIYTPPDPDSISTRALIVEWVDGASTFRLVAPRGQISGDVASTLNRTSNADLPISFTVTPAGAPVDGELDAQPFYLVTDHPAFATPVS